MGSLKYILVVLVLGVLLGQAFSSPVPAPKYFRDEMQNKEYRNAAKWGADKKIRGPGIDVAAHSAHERLQSGERYNHVQYAGDENSRRTQQERYERDHNKRRNEQSYKSHVGY